MGLTLGTCEITTPFITKTFHNGAIHCNNETVDARGSPVSAGDGRELDSVRDKGGDETSLLSELNAKFIFFT